MLTKKAPWVTFAVFDGRGRVVKMSMIIQVLLNTERRIPLGLLKGFFCSRPQSGHITSKPYLSAKMDAYT